jgi:ADP-ribose pyrophosphatase YjhB (NUDIX family)
MIYCQRCGSATEPQSRMGKVRPVCISCGAVTFFDPKLAAAVVIVDESRLLLGQRGESTREPGRWSFPAGFVERGERVEAAAAREAREETGLEIHIERLVGLYSEEDEPVVLAVYAATIVGGALEAGDDLVELAWFPLDALPDFAFAHDQQIVADWLALSGR